MDGKVVGRVVGGWWRMVGGWWEGGWRIVGRVVVVVGLLSSCNGNLRDRLVLPEKSGLFSSCEGPVGIPLESLPVNRSVSRVQSGNSVFLSCGNRNLWLPIEVQLGSQASSGVEAWNSAFLSSCQRAVMPPVKFRWGIWAFSRG